MPATYVISTASNEVVDVRFDVGYQGFAPDGTLAYDVLPARRATTPGVDGKHLLVAIGLG